MKKKEKTLPKKSNSALELNRKQVAGWLCFFLFTFGCMFVLGVFVGRGTAPVKFDIDKLQKELIALKDAVVKKEQLLLKVDPDAVKNKTDLGFYEVLKETRDHDRYDENHLTDASQQNIKPLLEKSVSRKNRQKMSKKAMTEKSGTVSAPEKINGVALDNNLETRGKLTIQVASSKDRDYANKMVVELNKKGYPAYRTIATIPGKGIWHRVRIGCFNNSAEADDTINRLKKDNRHGILVYR